jgi:tetratricopeptide (TPR) repeat protein
MMRSVPNRAQDSTCPVTRPSAGDLSDGWKRLSELEAVFSQENYSSRLLQDYYQLIVGLNQVTRGRRIFSELLLHRPYDNQVRSLLVALSLEQEDYLAALTEIRNMMAIEKPDDGLIDAGLNIHGKIDAASRGGVHRDGTSISLCMIVKNESAGLGACLHAVGALVDEIVVVDTGSEDRSRDIARIFGARTYSYAWDNDFSAARNIALNQAGCEWILVLDADEMIGAQDQSVLRRLLASHRGQPVAFSIETRNYTTLANTLGWQANAGAYPQQEAGLGWYPSRKVRIFPRSKSIHFCYPVHELVEPSLRAAGISIAHCPVPVHHYGHLNEARRREKSQAYFSLGYAKLEQLGDDRVALRELAVQAGQLALWPESMQLWQRFLKHQPDQVEAFVNMAGACWQMNRFEEALEHGRYALKLNPAIKEARFNIAISMLMTGRAGEATDMLQRMIDRDPNYLAAGFMLAAARACSGDLAGSQRQLRGLAQTPAGEALELSVKELTEKLRLNGLGGYADAVERMAECLNQ